MAFDFAPAIAIAFADTINTYDASIVNAKNVELFKIDAGELTNSGGVKWIPQDVMVRSKTGLTVADTDYDDISELLIPIRLQGSHMRNVLWDMTGLDLNKPFLQQNTYFAGARELASETNTDVVNKIASKATLLVANTAGIDTSKEVGLAEALMEDQQASSTMKERCLTLPPYIANNITGNLGARDYLGTDITKDAYTRSIIPMISGFSTFRAQNTSSITGSSGSGYLVNGANQRHTITAKNTDDLPVDNRTQTITVDTGTGATAGDVFTIAGVHAISHIDKVKSNKLKTFRIVSISTNTWTITPAIVPLDSTDVGNKQYANVDTTPADDAAITILNTDTTKPALFYNKEDVILVTSEFDTSIFETSANEIAFTHNTDLGVPVTLLFDTSINTLKAKFRLLSWFNTEVLNPETTGIMLENQDTAF